MKKMMQHSDTLQAFMFEHADIRGQLIHLEKTYQQIITQRPYPPMIQRLLGEALMCAVLIAGNLKFEGEVSLQLTGDERLPLLLAQCTHDLKVRAFASFNADCEDESYTDAFLKGTFSLVVNTHQRAHSYRSIVPIHSISIADNLMHYFSQSEQIATYIYLTVNDHQVAGVFLQSLPEENASARENFWEYAVKLGETLTAEELLSLDNQTILHRLYHETVLRLFSERWVSFQCRCSIEKMKQVIQVLGQKEAEALVKEKGVIDIHCEFCNQEYSFDSIDVSCLFRTHLLDTSIEIQDIISDRGPNAQCHDHYKK